MLIGVINDSFSENFANEQNEYNECNEYNNTRGSPHYILPILVPSSAKRIATQILVIAKFNRKIDFEVLFVISFVPARNYLFKVSNLRTRIRCASCSVLRMSMLTIFNINDVNGVVMVPLLSTVNIFQTFFLLLTWNRQTFSRFRFKKQTFLKTRSSISCVMY